VAAVYSACIFDLDAYLERIGLRGRPSVDEVHRAHITSIPFENLDPHRGVPVSLAVEDLERKLVTGRRGGYCYEQNLLLKAALEALGAEVDLFLARVRFGAPAGVMRPRSHLVLGVRAEGVSWHADAGFGSASLFEPLPFGPGAAHEQSGWRFRVVEDGAEFVLQLAKGEAWVDLYGFIPEPVPLVDVETSNWFSCTHPCSPFVTGLIAGLRADDGALTLLSDWSELALSEQTPAQTTVTAVARDAVPDLLATRFALPGFMLAADGRLVLADAG
jgi:N-hydroxyarylamine O-acetyltransferase